GAWSAPRAAAGTAWDRTRGTAATAAYRSRRTTGQGADRSWVPGSGGKQARDFLGARAQERFVAVRLHVQAQQGLGVGTAQVEAPVAEVGADAIGVVQRRRLRGEVVHHPRHGGLGVGDAEVDLAAARELAHAGLDQVAQAAAAGGDQAGDQQPGDHARVGIGELAEIVVRAHLAAIHAVLGAHLLLDEGVAALAQHRYAAGFLHLLDGVPDQARVVHDLAAGVLGQGRLGEQADQVVARDEAALLVEEEAAVEVAAPGAAEVGAVLAHRVDGSLAVLRRQRVGDAVGEAAVR